MPHIISRIVCTAIFSIMLPASILTAQSISGPDGIEQEPGCHPISFSFGDYDVISSIYVFLTTGGQQATCYLRILSLEKRSRLGFLLPPPLSLDLLFKEAVRCHYRDGHIPCVPTPNAIVLHAAVADPDKISCGLLDLLSLFHLYDQWVYDLECQWEQTPRISFTEFITESLFE